ncbi:MAG: hypothetical protein IJ053_05085 [Lachnospiraceae bacterium]|nr:hypothetical protein [Lachnospiraceae bacterium]
MDCINESEHKELIDILDDLIKTISLMRKNNSDYILVQNENEAREWMVFLKEHKDKEELRSLENEISDRFFYKYDVEIEKSELDNKRADLIKKYIFKSNKMLKM